MAFSIYGEEEVLEDRVECPKCGNYNPTESRFCAYCKHEINPPSFWRASLNASLWGYFDKISHTELKILVLFCASIVIALFILLSGVLPLEYSLPLIIVFVLAVCAISAYCLIRSQNVKQSSENEDEESDES
jgi:hypothetical protein